jgi:predicted double-glycine peptidase
MSKCASFCFFLLALSLSWVSFAENILNKQTVYNLIPVPLCRQDTSYYCGVAVMQSLLAYWGGEDIRQDILAKELKTTEKMGTNYYNIITLAQSKGYQASFIANISLAELMHYIDLKIPVICLIQAYADHSKKELFINLKNGHYVIAIGYDNKYVYFMDPSTIANYTYIEKEEFLERWIDRDSQNQKRLDHCGIIITKPQAVYNPNGILYLD